MYFPLKFFIFTLIFSQMTCKLFSTDPDIIRDVPGFLSSRNFKSEAHVVQTADGYLLTIFRIINPSKKQMRKKGRPILLWHGLYGSAEDWIKNRKGKLNINSGKYCEDNNSVCNNCGDCLTSTLGLTLSACGYDVWLANNRGNQYANRHVSLGYLDPKYWDYTLTEVALYDLNATFRHVLNITKKEEMSYIGYSMGTTIMFALLSLHPEYETYFRPFIGLAPVAFYGNGKGFFKLIAFIEPFLRWLSIPLGLPVPVAELVGSVICGNSKLVIICLFFSRFTFGPDPLNTDISRFPAHFGNFFDITSIRVLLHFWQLINSNRFAKFNYGVKGNRKHYNQDTNPDYPLTNITSKHIHLFSGQGDYFADPTDVQRLAKTVPVIKVINVSWPFWNHADPHMAKYENIYQDVHILKILRAYNKN